MAASEQIIEVLNYLGEKVGITVDWTAESIMPYLQELCGKFIKWEIATSSVWIVLGVICVIIACCLIKPAKKKWIKCHEDYEEEDENIFWLLSGIIVILLVIATPIIVDQALDIVQACTFPEKTIYEFIQPYLK